MTIQNSTDWAEVERKARKFEEGLPIELCSEYDAAAEYCARLGLTGEVGDPLPPNMDSDGALWWINAAPEAFQQRVRECAYWIAMERVNI